MARVTVEIPDLLARQAKAQAALDNESLAKLVEQALNEYLQKKERER
jgi:predicted HicB family RNase H-like nuclease